MKAMKGSWTDLEVPQKKTAVQWAALAGNRILIRHRRGIALLGGLDGALLQRLLELVDGRRGLAEIRAALEPAFGARQVASLLDQIWGELLEPVSSPAAAVPAPAPGPVPAATPQRRAGVLVVGEGLLAEGVGAGLERAGISCRKVASTESLLSADGLAGIVLLVAAPGQVSYQSLLDVQLACLDAGIAALFLTGDADGPRLGPSVIPAKTPCWACHQLAGFRALCLPPATLLAGIGNLETLAEIEPGPLAAAVEGTVAEVAALLGRGGVAQLLFAAEVHGAGGWRRYALARLEGCPLCGGRAYSKAASVLEHAARQADREWAATFAGRPTISLSTPGERRIRSVGILGGGTAGYLSALALRKKHPHLAVTLIESGKLPIIGVGEATTPLMPQFLHLDLGLDIHEFFHAVKPTFKLGIRFTWGPSGEAVFNYPFGKVRVLEPWLFENHVGRCSLQSMMMSAGKLPLEAGPAGGNGFGLGVETAYHLENRRFVAFLRKQAAARGVERIDTLIEDLALSADRESIDHLVAEDGRELAFDLYLDCSGFQSRLIEKGLGSAFVDYHGSLFTDRAIIAALPHGGVIQPYTHAEAMDAGWCWNTPQVAEDHRGYVYRGSFLDEDRAVAEMRRKNPGMGEVRTLRFRPGRRSHFWKGNVVALGNAYGFVEPLESTALHMLIRQIGLLSGALASGGATPASRALLNRKVGGWWDYLCWFLAIHYKFNPFPQTPFWRACRADVDISAYQELIDAFTEGGPLSYNRGLPTAFDFPDPLWGAQGIDILLLGQRVPFAAPRLPVSQRQWRRWASISETTVQRAPDQARLLALLEQRPELLQGFLANYQRVGPAFGGS